MGTTPSAYWRKSPMICGTVSREGERAWSHRRLTRVDSRESLTPGEPTRPASDSWSFRLSGGHTPAIEAQLPNERTSVTASGVWGGALQPSRPGWYARNGFRGPSDGGAWGGAPQIRRVGGRASEPHRCATRGAPCGSDSRTPSRCCCSPSLTFSSEHQAARRPARTARSPSPDGPGSDSDNE